MIAYVASDEAVARWLAEIIEQWRRDWHLRQAARERGQPDCACFDHLEYG